MAGPHIAPLDDRAAVVAVVVELGRVLDERRWAALDQVFTDDASGYGAHGRAAVEATVRRHLDGCGPTQHLLGNHHVEIDDGRATCISNVRAFHLAADGSGRTYEVLGTYTDDLTRDADGWRITNRHFDVQIELGDRSVLQPA